MQTLFDIIAVTGLVVAIVALCITQNRYKRLRKRIAWHGRREGELLRLVKSIGARAGSPVHEAPELRSQWGEDLLLLELFGWKPDGGFVEVGAYDGLSHSVSAAFEAIGWMGVLIEPVPDLFNRARSNRPDATVVHAALSRTGATGTAPMRAYSSENEYDTASHLIATTDSTTVKRPPGKAGDRIVEVPMMTMDRVLDESGVQPGGLDFASIDVEGHELDLLDGFDLDRWKPRVILIEDHSMADDSPIAHHLDTRGYTTAGWIAWNRVMIRTDDAELLARAGRVFQQTEANRSIKELVAS